MKPLISLTLFALTSTAHAQQAVNPAQLPGSWACQVNLTTAHTITTITGRATYMADGSVTHKDIHKHALLTGESIEMRTLLVGHWRFDRTHNRLIETITNAQVTYDNQNPLANTVGARTQRSYQDALNKEQSSQAVRLNNSEWLALIPQPNREPVLITCNKNH
ncbi:MAG: hypothetical protein ACRCV6_11065 [Formosimonas sp.]